LTLEPRSLLSPILPRPASRGWGSESDCGWTLIPELSDTVGGHRTAPDWVIDQYRVKTDKRSGITSDPNRPDDPEYIVRLVGQVVRVSLETVNLVGALPPHFGAGKG